MSEHVENIDKRDVLWSYASMFLLVGSGIILLPFMLNKMPSDTIGMWQIFQTITALVLLLDFGFRPSFSRNVSYIFSGVQMLQKEGVNRADNNGTVHYGLLQSTLGAMKRFYRYIALAVLVLLSTAGTVYIYFIMQKYAGDVRDAWVAWGLLITINSYSLYTQYYDALLTGKGYIKRNQQIIIVSQLIYLSVAVGLIYAGLGLSAVVGAQLLSTIVRRVLAKRTFFTKEMLDRLANAMNAPQTSKEVLRVITPNATKVGLTYVGAFLVSKAALLMGSIFLSLEQIAVYGISMQVLDVLARCGMVYYISYIPKLAQYRAENALKKLWNTYCNSIALLIGTYIVGGVLFILFGEWALRLIGSSTSFLPTKMLFVALLISFLEHNHSISAGFIMADNKIPFFIPSLLSGAATIFLLWLFLSPFHWGVWGMILAPGLAQLAYQNWKWPSVVIHELFPYR